MGGGEDRFLNRAEGDPERERHWSSLVTESLQERGGSQVSQRLSWLLPTDVERRRDVLPSSYLAQSRAEGPKFRAGQ